MITARTKTIVLRMLKDEREYYAAHAAFLSRDATLRTVKQAGDIKRFRAKAGALYKCIAELEALPTTPMPAKEGV